MTQPRVSGFTLLYLPPAGRRLPGTLVLAAHAETGQTGWAACPDKSEPWDTIERLCPGVVGQAASDANARHVALGLTKWPFAESGYLTAAGCIDDAVLDLAARIAGVPLALWLGGRANPRIAVADRVAWSDAPARLSADDRVGWLVERAAERAERFGFGCLTVHPARAEAASARALLDALRRQFGMRVTLRIDFGGAYPAAAVREVIDAARALGVDALIEPGRGAKGCTLPLAIRPGPTLHEQVRDGAAQIVRLAPTIHGGALAAQRFAATARIFQVELLFANATGLDIELALLGQLAQATPATLQPLALGADPSGDLAIRAGALVLPDGPGLGIAPDLEALAHHALARSDIGAAAAAAQ